MNFVLIALLVAVSLLAVYEVFMLVKSIIARHKIAKQKSNNQNVVRKEK